MNDLPAMAYQVGKAAGGLAAALEGRVDAVLLTGGLCHLEPFVALVRRRVAFIAPVALFPGEDELRALAEGALRVLRGEEPARPYLLGRGALRGPGCGAPPAGPSPAAAQL